MTQRPAFYPASAPIDAYGNGGFRFAGMSHRGSILVLPSGIYGWDIAANDGVTADDLAQVLTEHEQLSIFLLGTGPTQVFPDPILTQVFADVGIGLEPMSTGTAARTFNVLLAEGRDVGAALLAVD